MVEDKVFVGHPLHEHHIAQGETMRRHFSERLVARYLLLLPSLGDCVALMTPPLPRRCSEGCHETFVRPRATAAIVLQEE